jgi:hypothetical protein
MHRTRPMPEAGSSRPCITTWSAPVTAWDQPTNFCPKHRRAALHGRPGQYRLVFPFGVLRASGHSSGRVLQGDGAIRRPFRGGTAGRQQGQRAVLRHASVGGCQPASTPCARTIRASGSSARLWVRSSHHQVLRTEAITTTIASVFANARMQLSRNPFTRHGLRSRRRGSAVFAARARQWPNTPAPSRSCHLDKPP